MLEPGELRFPFGSLVMAHNAKGNTTNSMSPRASKALTLGPSGNHPDNQLVLFLDRPNRIPVVRSNLHPVPMTAKDLDQIRALEQADLTAFETTDPSSKLPIDDDISGGDFPISVPADCQIGGDIHLPDHEGESDGPVDSSNNNNTDSDFAAAYPDMDSADYTDTDHEFGDSAEGSDDFNPPPHESPGYPSRDMTEEFLKESSTPPPTPPIPAPVVPPVIDYPPDSLLTLPKPDSPAVSNPRKALMEIEPKSVALLTLAGSIKKHGTEKTTESALVEVKQLLDLDVWKFLRPKETTSDMRYSSIPMHIIVTQKVKTDGSPGKLKSRIVAGGHLQNRDQYDPDDIESPTASQAAIATVINITALTKGWAAVVDVKGAYLNSHTKRRVYIRLKGDIVKLILDIRPDLASRMDSTGQIFAIAEKGIYGLIEAAKLWYDLVSSVLGDMGFKTCPSDPCVYSRLRNEIMSIIALYVDDLYITSPQDDEISCIIDEFKTHFPDISVQRGDHLEYLGMAVDIDRSGQIRLRTQGKLEQIITDGKISGNVATPSKPNLFNIDEHSPLLSKAKAKTFYSVVAKLMWIATRTRPDILVTVSALSSRTSNPNEDDFEKLLHLLKYINGTVDLPLILRPTSINVSLYADASFGSHPQSFKSHSGPVCCIGGTGPVYFKSSKQHLNAKSSTEAELIACSDGAGQGLWIVQLLKELGFNPDPLIIHQDNQSAIALLNRGRPASAASRHFNIRLFWLKDYIDRGELEVVYCPDIDMLADTLSKPEFGARFKDHRALLMGLNLPEL
jgi:hypothetical protein